VKPLSEVGKLMRKIRGTDSLRVAGEKTGISHNFLSIVEKGIDPRSGSPIKPSPDTLKAFASGYGYPYEELMKVAGYIEEDDNRDPAIKLIEYLELELTDDEIIEKMIFKVDDMTLSEDEVREFIAFVRAKRFMKKQAASVSKPEEL